MGLSMFHNEEDVKIKHVVDIWRGLVFIKASFHSKKASL